MLRVKSHQARDAWLRSTLGALPDGASILDVGAGECANKPFCAHLDYVAQDIAQYDGKGDGAGLHTDTWDFHQIDIICDLYDIPEERKFDHILCSEVLEHVVDPVRALEKLARLVAPEGSIILTAPFNSLTHFAPYHYCTGFSRYFYEYHFERLGFQVQTLQPNGGHLDYLDQELGRVKKVRKTYDGWRLDPLSRIILGIARLNVRLLAALDGPRNARKSSELQSFGWHVVARRKGV
ncbi:MAG: methyltransferase domain-containing protein [Rhodobacteraceae bacterium]|nr:methyltransferase domain-containing protein [Paracoccaceae bacterium]